MEAIRQRADQEILFAGEFVYSIDPQRRIAIPSEWRSQGGENRFYVLPGRHKALQLMTFDGFKSLADKLRKVSIVDPKSSMALARLGASARECRCDKQGRVSIPEQLLEYAEIKKDGKIDDELVLIGVFNSIQIWSKENWKKQCMSDEEMLDILQNIEEMPDDLTNFLKKKKE